MSNEEIALLEHLQAKHSSGIADYEVKEAYYDGQVRLGSMGLSLPPELSRLQIVVNWPRLAVDSLEERLDIEGFRLAGETATISRLWEWWLQSDMPAESGRFHVEMLSQGRAYITVGINETTGGPLYKGESIRDMIAECDPRTEEVTHAARFYRSNPNQTGSPDAATLYTPMATAYYFKDNKGDWAENTAARNDHRLGKTLVVVGTNRARLGQRWGQSEMEDVAQLTDAACRALTNLQGAQEFLAVPSRYVFGVGPEDMMDQNGNPVPKWEAYIGRLNAFSNPDVKVQQLTGADLNQFVSILNMYARLASSVTGLSPAFLGLTSDHPVSAEALNASDNRLVKRSERKQRTLDPVWRQVNHLGMLLVDGVVDPSMFRLEAVWRDPSTPTLSSRAAAVVQLFNSGNGLLPQEAAWQELGYSPERIAELKQMEASSSVNKFLAGLPPINTPTGP